MKAIYLRKSRAGEEEDALQTHRAVLVKMCEQNDWSFEIYEEIASGVSDKEQLNKLLENIDRYDGIVCMDIDRLSRSEVESLQIKALLLQKGLRVYTPNGTFDPATDGMLYSLRAIFANEEYIKIKTRMQAGKRNRFKSGEFSYGRPPFGYKIENKRLVIDEEKARVVRDIFDLCISGLGMYMIAQKIEEKYGTPSPVSYYNIKRILKNETYIGTVTIDLYKNGKVVEAMRQPCPQIISVETFVQAQEELKRRTATPAVTRGTIRSIVTGLCKCGICGNQMTIKSTKTTTLLACTRPKCPNSGINLSYVEKFVSDTLDDNLSVLYDALEKRMNMTVVNTLPDEIKAIQDDIEDLEGQAKRLRTLFVKGDIPQDEYEEMKSELDTEISEKSLKLRALREQNARNEVNRDLRETVELIRDLERFDEIDDVTEQNAILRRLIDKIVYTRHVPKDVSRITALVDYPPTIEIIYKEM